jgi:hypothetical protein
MINPNKNTTQETLCRLEAEAYERFRINLHNAIQQKLDDLDMSWGDLSSLLETFRIGDEFTKMDDKTNQLRGLTGDELKAELGDDPLTLEELNMIASCFSCDIQIIFKPRYPYTCT